MEIERDASVPGAEPERPSPAGRTFAGPTSAGPTPAGRTSGPGGTVGAGDWPGPPADGSWGTDVLGAPFQCRTLRLVGEDGGETHATLVRDSRRPRAFTPRGDRRRRAERARGTVPGERGVGPSPIERAIARDTDVLYLHGWSDYFFQRELAEFWHRRGARFHALDLRAYGRSLEPGQAPGYVSRLETYDADIEAALEAMGHGRAPAGRAPRRRLVLLAHSTGGLTASLWANRNPGRLSALVLNAPWLEFQAGELGRGALGPLVSLGAHYDPRARLPGVDFGYYSRATSARLGGEWDLEERWRPERGFPVSVGWLSAVLAGHASVAAGLAIDAPVLVLLSDRSTVTPAWSERMRHSDSVLVVDDIARRALRLGPAVSVTRVAGALHDVFLSEPEVRAEAYDRLEDWLRGYRP